MNKTPETNKQVDLDNEINSILSGFGALINNPPVKTTLKGKTVQKSGMLCKAKLKANPYTGQIIYCDRLLVPGHLCSGGHKEYIKYDDQGVELYREALE